MMENINNDDIANYVKKDKKTISGWRIKQPKLLEIVRIGSFCKKNDLDIEKIRKLVELQEMIKGKDWIAIDYPHS